METVSVAGGKAERKRKSLRKKEEEDLEAAV